MSITNDNQQSTGCGCVWIHIYSQQAVDVHGYTYTVCPGPNNYTPYYIVGDGTELTGDCTLKMEGISLGPACMTSWEDTSVTLKFASLQCSERQDRHSEQEEQVLGRDPHRIIPVCSAQRGSH